MSYTGGWKSVFYSLHVAKEVGMKSFYKSLTSKNTCKTCAYGMGGQNGGMTNEAGGKIEICKKSMQAYLGDNQKPIPTHFFVENSIEEIRKNKPKALERLGRLNDVLYKAKGDTHYTSINWEDAYALISKRMLATSADKSFFYSSGRSSNEAAFLLQLFARVYGTNNVNNCSYYCHQASGVGMGSTLGTGTATVRLTDLKKSDCIFVIGANPSSNHPRFVTELMHCRRRGGKVIVINPVKEPGLVKFSIPSDVRSFLSSGSKIASHYYQPKIGGDWALLKGIAKYLLENNLQDKDFISNHTSSFDSYKKDIENESWENIVSTSGLSKTQIEEIALVYTSSNNVIFTWAMGITHHIHGVENVQAIVNLAMLRGMLGRKNAGLLPLRGHSNVQGIGSIGFTPKLKDQIFKLIEKNLDVTLPIKTGWHTMECMDEAMKGNVDIAFMLGGNLLASNPNRKFAEQAINNIPLKVYFTTTINQTHLYGIDEEVIILPVVARDEESQKTSQESMFNFVRLSDGGEKRCNNTLSETEIIASIAERVIPSSTFNFSDFKSHSNLRKAIAKTIPGFEAITQMDDDNSEFQIGGRTFHTPEFNTKDKKAIFIPNPLPANDENSDLKLMSVRSEGQFNSIIYEEEDHWRGVKDRNVILMNKEDLQIQDLVSGDFVDITSSTGKMEKVRVKEFDISKGSVLGYYPETNILISSQLDPKSKTPAFKSTNIRITKSQS